MKKLAAWLLLSAAWLSSAAMASAQTKGEMSMAVTYDATYAGLTNVQNNFWMQGGGIDLAGTFWHGLGAVAQVQGMHTANTGQGVPLSMITATFGPRYTWRRGRVDVFGQGLVGEADGFRSLFPTPHVAITSANGLAAQAGGGLDLRIARHVSVRALQVSWLRTQLPNSTTNVQNDLAVGAGIVWHSR
jgi:hypothetical protein